MPSYNGPLEKSVNSHRNEGGGPETWEKDLISAFAGMTKRLDLRFLQRTDNPDSCLTQIMVLYDHVVD